MRIEEIVKSVIEINGYDELNPVQKEAIKYYKENVLVCTPTASGKTTVFEVFMLNCLLNRFRKVIYISPLKALTQEHYNETKRKFGKKYGIKVGISTGDLDHSVKNINDYDVLFLTYEKFDSIIRHQKEFLEEVGVITIDEVHEVGSNRGAVLEVLITQIKNNYKNVQLLALSATIGNSEQLSEWIGGKLVKSEYRPVALKKGILFENHVIFDELDFFVFEEYDEKLVLKNIILDTINKNKQIIIFCNSRKNTISLAGKYSKVIGKILPEKQKKELRNIGKKIIDVLNDSTEQCRKLGMYVCDGVGFHNAGLVYKQRMILEEEFKAGKIPVLFATTTLAAGINLPAYRVVINSMFRFSNGGIKPLPVNEYFQMVGRAGRPKYDKSGEAFILVNRKEQIEGMFESYVNGVPTPIDSQLAKIENLSTHILSIIMINDMKSIDDIINFISKTFYYKVFGNTLEVENNVLKLLEDFERFGYVFVNGKEITITELGKKVCLLYLEPYSAHNIIEDLKIKAKNEADIYEKIFTFVNTSELNPYININEEKRKEMLYNIRKVSGKVYFDDYDVKLEEKMYLCLMIKDWVSEKNEDELIKEYGITPGKLQEVIEKIKWISHCVLELFKYIDVEKKELYNDYKKLRQRIVYGVKEELITLVELPNIGRKRSRLLYNFGFKSIKDIENKPEDFLRVVGKFGLKTLEMLKVNVEIREEKQEEEKEKNIFDY